MIDLTKGIRMRLVLTCVVVSLSSCVIADNALWETHPLASGSGYTWTMTSRLSGMLEMAEKLFGPRDVAWTILGAEIRTDDGGPQNWFPGYPRRKHIVFQVAATATNGTRFACYQLAHEVVHALAPEVGKSALVIEEGTATWFAAYYVKKVLGVDMHASFRSYRRAERAVDGLLRRDRDAIRKLRMIEPSFKKMTADTFKRAGVVATDAELEVLLSPFVRAD